MFNSPIKNKCHWSYLLFSFFFRLIYFLFSGNWSQEIYCQAKKDENSYRITKASQTLIWNSKWNKMDDTVYYKSILLSCQMPKDLSNQYNISLSTEPCITNEVPLKIKTQTKNNNNKNTRITVCIKPLNFPNHDISKRLVQWIEMNRILGATSFDIFVEKVHKNVWKVLQWYETTYKRLVRVIKYKCISASDKNLGLAEDEQIWQKRRCELLPYNDCLYRNLQASHYIIPLDIDEIIVPRSALTWQQLIKQIPKAVGEEYASFTVPNAYYFSKNNDTTNQTAFFFKDLARTPFSDPGNSGKSFVSTSKALTVFNHYALHVLRPETRACYFLQPELVQMNHYKDECVVRLLPECAKYLQGAVRIRDAVILKYRERFEERYAEVRKRLFPLDVT